MEIDVTNLVVHGDVFEFSASVAERGANAAKETWNAAKEEAAVSPLMTDEQLPAFRDYVQGFGAWEREEIDAWDATECNALLVQMVAGDLREIEGLCDGDGAGGIDWAKYSELSERGTVAGRLYEGSDGKIYYYVGG